MDLPILPIQAKIFLIVFVIMFYAYPLLFTIVNMVCGIINAVLRSIANLSRK